MPVTPPRYMQVAKDKIEGLQICPSSVKITSVGNVSKNMNNEWNEVNYTEELKEKNQRFCPSTWRE